MGRGRVIAALVSLLVLAAALVVVAVMLFQVRVIKVSGCASLEAGQVAGLSGIEIGQSIFLVDKQGAMEALAADPVIKPVSVRVAYPYTVEIVIEERLPAVYIDVNGIRLTLDNEAVVLAVDSSPQGEALPQLAGFSTARFEVGKPLGEDAYKRGVLTRLLAALKDGGVGVVRIDLSYASSMKLETPDGFTIRLGGEDALTDKLALAERALGEVAALGKTGGIIDVATAKDAYYREN